MTSQRDLPSLLLCRTHVALHCRCWVVFKASHAVLSKGSAAFGLRLYLASAPSAAGVIMDVITDFCEVKFKENHVI